jgi:hypothetical protein
MQISRFLEDHLMNEFKWISKVNAPMRTIHHLWIAVENSYLCFSHKKVFFSYMHIDRWFFYVLRYLNYYEEVKFYWTTDRSHLRSEWIHVQIKEKSRIIRALSQTLKRRLSNTSRHITSSMYTNHEWESQFLYSARQAHQWDYVFPTGIFHSAELSYNHLHTQIRSSTIRSLPRCDRTEQCPDKTLDIVQTKLLSSFWPSNQGRSVTSRMSEPTSIRRVPFRLPCSHQRRCNQTLEIAWR